MKRRNFIQSLNLGIASSLFLNSDLQASPIFSFADLSQDTELSYHRIQNIRFSNVRMQYPRLVGKNARLDIHGYGPRLDICIIETDKGAMGWASLRGAIRGAQEVAKEIIGKKVSEVFAVNVGIVDSKYIPFDAALHDLSGIILRKPVYALLGQDKPITTKYYSGMIYFDDLEFAQSPGGIDKVLENCKQDYDFGYRQFKVKIGRGNRWMSFKEGLQRDIEVTKKIAEAFPDCEILVDGNNGFSADEFIKYLKGISGLNLFWIEEPFHETVAEYTYLREWLNKEGKKTLLADGEADADQGFIMDLLEKKLIDVHLTDIEELGFTHWRKLMPRLKQMGALASPHAWGSLLKTHYIAQLAGGLGNTITIEGVTSMSDDVDLSGYKIMDGKLVPPNTPGFGMPLLKKI